jgi:excinuclease ABC subunit B
LTGSNEFLAVFGNITVAQLVYIIMAIVFLILVYRKVGDYLYKRHDAEQEKDKQLKEALEAASHYPEYRKQSLEIQQQLTKEMQAASKLLEFEHAAYLRDKIEKLRRGK